MNETRRASEPGQAVYNRLTLSLYDTWVHGVSNSLLWRCPTAELQALYARCAGGAHLDVGVGTGKLLADCDFNGARQPRIGLLDMNAASLARAAARIAARNPQRWQRDVLRPLAIDAEPFESIGLTYLLHCLPGPWTYKLTALDHLLPWLADGGCLFGATILGDPPPRSRAARALMALYNRRGIFDNDRDHEAGLRQGLAARFDQVDCRRIGAVMLFEARQPKATT